MKKYEGVTYTKMFRGINVIFSLIIICGIFSFGNCSICGITICRRHYREDDFIYCDKGRILIENVTRVDTNEENKWALKSLRRICTGKTTKCDVYQICQDPRNHDLRVTYTCNYLPQSEPSETCVGDIMVLNHEQGFIFSPRYPDIVTASCSWRISVPDNHYSTLKIHDLEKPKINRDSGLQIRTTRKCPDNLIPAGLVYEIKNHSVVYQACGDVDIDLVTNGVSGLRFWISYQVFPRYTSIPIQYQTTYSCPPGTETKQEIQRPKMVPPGVPPIIITRTISMMNTTLHVGNETGIDKIETKSSDSINAAERMIFYVAIVIAFLSLQALIIVTVVCIRRQRHLKANGPIIDHSSIPATHPTSINSNRPLPPVQPAHAQLTNSPSLMDGYGVVADELEQGCYDQSIESSAYAEVDDTLPYRPNNMTYNLDRPKMQEVVENVYSELKDSERNGYWEIADTTWHNGPCSKNDQAKLIKGNKSRKSQISNHSGKSRPSSFEGPFSHSNRKSQPGEQSDSDDSLFGDEQYDYIESAHV